LSVSLCVFQRRHGEICYFEIEGASRIRRDSEEGGQLTGKVSQTICCCFIRRNRKLSGDVGIQYVIASAR
jgi:hypothetical protein